MSTLKLLQKACTGGLSGYALEKLLRPVRDDLLAVIAVQSQETPEDDPRGYAKMYVKLTGTMKPGDKFATKIPQGLPGEGRIVHGIVPEGASPHGDVMVPIMYEQVEHKCTKSAKHPEDGDGDSKKRKGMSARERK